MAQEAEFLKFLLLGGQCGSVGAVSQEKDLGRNVTFKGEGTRGAVWG